MASVIEALEHLGQQLRQHGLLVHVGPPAEGSPLTLWPWWLQADAALRAAPRLDPGAPAGPTGLQLHCLLVAGHGPDAQAAFLRAHGVLLEQSVIKLGDRRFEWLPGTQIGRAHV